MISQEQMMKTLKRDLPWDDRDSALISYIPTKTGAVSITIWHDDEYYVDLFYRGSIRVESSKYGSSPTLEEATSLAMRAVAEANN